MSMIHISDFFKKIERLYKKVYLKFILRVQYSGGVIIRCGNDYGGFSVDAGILDEISSQRKLIIYSFGIGQDLSFSEDIYKKWECDIYAFDPTPKAAAFVHNSDMIIKEGFHFYEWGLSNQDGIGKFHLPKEELYVPDYLVNGKRVEEVSGSLLYYDGVKTASVEVELKTLKTIMNELGHNEIDLLKMDIEGMEFLVLEEIIDSKCLKFKELCLEVHNRFLDNGNILLKNLINQLNKEGYYIINVSQTLNEITLVKRNRGVFERCR